MDIFDSKTESSERRSASKSPPRNLRTTDSNIPPGQSGHAQSSPLQFVRRRAPVSSDQAQSSSREVSLTRSTATRRQVATGGVPADQPQVKSVQAREPDIIHPPMRQFSSKAVSGPPQLSLSIPNSVQSPNIVPPLVQSPAVNTATYPSDVGEVSQYESGPQNPGARPASEFSYQTELRQPMLERPYEKKKLPPPSSRSVIKFAPDTVLPTVSERRELPPALQAGFRDIPQNSAVGSNYSSYVPPTHGGPSNEMFMEEPKSILKRSDRTHSRGKKAVYEPPAATRPFSDTTAATQATRDSPRPLERKYSEEFERIMEAGRALDKKAKERQEWVERRLPIRTKSKYDKWKAECEAEKRMEYERYEKMGMEALRKQ